jgi:hypothetical protein
MSGAVVMRELILRLHLRTGVRFPQVRLRHRQTRDRDPSQRLEELSPYALNLRRRPLFSLRLNFKQIRSTRLRLVRTE